MTENKKMSNLAVGITKEERVRLKGHRPAIVWLTGIPASGKTTILNALEAALNQIEVHTFVIDGDNVRADLNKDLDFSKAGRAENIRRIGHIAKYFVSAGIVVICAFVSPYRQDRRLVRTLVEEGEFIEVYLKCPVNVCIERDPKGMYKKAINNQIGSFTGVSDSYEAPQTPEIVIETDKITINEGVEIIIDYLAGKRIINKGIKL